jgi:hypothetical protein
MSRLRIRCSLEVDGSGMLSVRPRVLRNEACSTAGLGRSFAPTTVVQPPYRISLQRMFPASTQIPAAGAPPA